MALDDDDECKEKSQCKSVDRRAKLVTEKCMHVLQILSILHSISSVKSKAPSNANKLLNLIINLF